MLAVFALYHHACVIASTMMSALEEAILVPHLPVYAIVSILLLLPAYISRTMNVQKAW